MNDNEFKKEELSQKPIIAICYDFDKTLSPDDMQAQGYIQTVFGDDVNKFWQESNDMAFNNNMDQNLAYMYKMLDEARGKELFTKNRLMEYGKNIKYYKGLPDWFDNINNIAKEDGVIVEHYVISSGLKEIIDGTIIAKYFKMIYASQYYYDKKGVCIWPAQVINYTNKTQFLFRISKGLLNVNDSRVNDKIAKDNIRIPFKNFIYIGDSDTDIPCMKIVKERNGHSIGVYDLESNNKYSKVVNLFNDGRLNFFAECDYSIDSKLFNYIKNIIRSTKINYENNLLELECLDIVDKYKKELYYNDDDVIKENLILKLIFSDSFAMTHTIVGEAKNITNWTDDQIIKLCRAGIYNSQVAWVLNDYDVKAFYKNILNSKYINDENVKKIQMQL